MITPDQWTPKEIAFWPLGAVDGDDLIAILLML